jgi:hypothetical protein
MMANDNLRGFPVRNARRGLRAIAALAAAGVLLQLAACGTPAPPAPSAQRMTWEPGCTGPASFCVPFFGP